MISPAKLARKQLAANARIRVLVVDDSVVIRRLVSHALSEDDQIEVVGAAPNGSIALQRIEQQPVDAVTLDIEMPEMDGLETLRRLRKKYPELPVIMFSTLTERGAGATLDALALGANDYVTKAANVGSLEKSMASLRSELVPKIKQFFQIGAAAPKPAVEPVAAPVVPRAATFARPALSGIKDRRVVAIGVSTGGPQALADVLPMFPKNFKLPIVIVQHMPPLFTRLLAERLNAISQIQVEEAKAGTQLEPGKALMAPGGFHMRVRSNGKGVVTTLDEEPPENSCRPAVDVLFRSVAEVYGGRSIGVVLTGMGYDGLRGSEVLRQQGSYIIAQDERSSVVWGMPGAVSRAGLADATLDLGGVVPEILRQI